MENHDLESLINEALVKISQASFMANIADKSAYATNILRMALCVAEEVLPEMTVAPGSIKSMLKLAEDYRFEEIELYVTEGYLRNVITDDPKAEAKLFLHSAKNIASLPFDEKRRPEFLLRFEKGLRILYEHDRTKDWAKIIMEK